MKQYVSYNSNTGIFELNPIIDPGYDVTTIIPLFTQMEENSCIIISEETAKQVNSNYIPNSITGYSKPIVHGVVLNHGNISDPGVIANRRGVKYSTSASLGISGTFVYLGKNGKLTTITPSISGGDTWYVVIGYRVNEFEFIFDPQSPLAAPLNPVDYVLPGSNVSLGDEKIILGNTMAAFTAFKVGSDGNAFTITANDVNLPIVDGITLEAGGINSQVSVARIRGLQYQTLFDFISSSIYYLSTTGLLTTTRPTNTNYQVIVGRSIINSKYFIFDPQFPISII